MAATSTIGYLLSELRTALALGVNVDVTRAYNEQQTPLRGKLQLYVNVIADTPEPLQTEGYSRHEVRFADLGIYARWHGSPSDVDSYGVHRDAIEALLIDYATTLPKSTTTGTFDITIIDLHYKGCSGFIDDGTGKGSLLAEYTVAYTIGVAAL